MEVSFEKYGFYVVDIDYVKFLHSKDTQVFYSAAIGYDKKPYLGLIINLCGFSYCIPLTSAKPNQLKWNNITEHNYLIYENVEASELRRNDIHKKIGEIEKDGNKVSIHKKILAVLEIRKMIPVDDSLYSYIDFAKVSDTNYLSLLQKEYSFLIPHKDNILKKARSLYVKQKDTGVIGNCYCRFSLLELAFEEYIISKQIADKIT